LERHVCSEASDEIELLKKLLGKIRGKASNQIELLRKLLGKILAIR